MTEPTNPETENPAAEGQTDDMPVLEGALMSTAPDTGMLDRVLEALLLASDLPLSVEQLQRLLVDDFGVGKKDLREALARLSDALQERAVELREVATGYRIQVRQDYAGWVSRLWQEKPPRMSRALMETLALICYRQPITRGEIEEVRGVALSPNIIRTLLERGWIREVGVKEVPGRPSLFGTTPQFLDDLNLKSLDDLPDLPAIKDPEQLEAALSQLGEQLHEVSHVAEETTDAADMAPVAVAESEGVDSVEVDEADLSDPAPDLTLDADASEAEALDSEGAEAEEADADSRVDVEASGVIDTSAVLDEPLPASAQEDADTESDEDADLPPPQGAA